MPAYTVGHPPRSVRVEGEGVDGASVELHPGNEYELVRAEPVTQEGHPALSFELATQDGFEAASAQLVLADTTATIFHLRVRPRLRGEGAGATMFNLLVGVALVSDAETVKARVGGGEDTAGFFEAMGVPADVVETNDPQGTAGFAIDRDRLAEAVVTER